MWNDRPLFGLNDLTMGILGYGKIGKAVAKRARGFDMNIIGLCKKEKPSDGYAERIVGIEDLEPVLSESHVVVVILPLTPETEGLIDEQAFGKMRKGSFIINVARGPIINEEALIEALRSGPIAGAALDVFNSEPLPPSSPLWEIPNLFITSHVGGVSDRLWNRMIDLFFDNLERKRQGRPLVNIVDRNRGY
jgi:phosphoglycerate dehydrogenase-like enzyme